MDEPLTDSTYLILLALLKPKHGYVIMKQINELSQGTYDTYEIGPATMYTILKKLTKNEMISLEETTDRKKIYQITAKGKAALEKDIQRRKHFFEIGEQIMGELGGLADEQT